LIKTRRFGDWYLSPSSGETDGNCNNKIFGHIHVCWVHFPGPTG